MKNFKFKKIDAFTNGDSSGNPAAAIYLESSQDMSENEMQVLASQLKGFVNEVAYVVREDDVYLRYYSSECEVDFCGHATIAVMHDLIKNDKELLAKDIIKLRVKNEYLDVFNDILQNDSVYITAPKPEYNNMNLEVENISKALKINSEEIDKQYKLDLINAGLNTLIVPIRKLDCILNINPNQEELKDFCINNGIDIILVFSKEVSSSNNSFRTRVFAPKFGYLEDPATGSGNSAFGYYMLKEGMWNGNKISIEQNNSFNNANIVVLNTVKKDNEVKVIFGGSAVVKIDGEYYF